MGCANLTSGPAHNREFKHTNYRPRNAETLQLTESADREGLNAMA